jgi:hypothetical protein
MIMPGDENLSGTAQNDENEEAQKQRWRWLI